LKAKILTLKALCYIMVQVIFFRLDLICIGRWWCSDVWGCSRVWKV